jgi:hypothetical protein
MIAILGANQRHARGGGEFGHRQFDATTLAHKLFSNVEQFLPTGFDIRLRTSHNTFPVLPG